MKTAQIRTATLLSSPAWACALAALLLVACGGGGGSDAADDASRATISTASATPVRYGDTMTITLVGTGLDAALTLSSPGCRNFVRGTAAPLLSTATTAYYTCTVSGATGDQQVTVSGGGTVLARVPFSTAVPQVTLLLSNGAGVAGPVVVTLNPTAAPITVDNFLGYVRSGFYNGTVIHRNFPGFVLQGGGFNGPMTVAGGLGTPKPGNAPIVLEDGNGLSNTRLTLAMARLQNPDTATSEFFINLANNAAILDRTATRRGYAVFGSITSGEAVITAAESAPCASWGGLFGPGDLSCLPTPNITIASASQTR
jgi:peptidyl-prolyl cis-trans isomerase A (cyclophilin A)